MYEKCAARAAYKHLDKLPEPSSPAMARGIEIGGLAEKYLKGELATLPEELKELGSDYDEIRTWFLAQTDRELPVYVEENWGFDKDWKPVPWDDWNNCVLRIKTDIAYFVDPVSMCVDDNKTGKFRLEKHQDYVDQLNLYVVGAMARFPRLERATSRLLYIDEGVVYPRPEDEPVTLLRKDYKKARASWDKRAAKMMADGIFKATPSNDCRWCPYSKSKNGPCSF